MFFIVFIIVGLSVGAYLLFKKLNPDATDKVVDKILKVAVVVLFAAYVLRVLLPDSFIRCLSYDEAKNNSLRLFAVLRWLNALTAVVLPVAVFFDNKYFKDIAVFICIPITIVSVCFSDMYIAGFIDEAGRGLNSVSGLSEGFRAFLFDGTFRSICLYAFWVLELSVPVILALKEKIIFRKRDKKEIGITLLVALAVTVGAIPIYIPQYLFGYSDILFDKFTLPQFIWMFLIAAEIVVLYRIFKDKDAETKEILCLVLSLMLLSQYTQMFGAVSINARRLPFQLCNIGSFLVLAFVITKSKKIFDFAIIVNVVGVLIAVAMPDLDGEGLFYLWNMHFVLEHTNVLVVPVLALLLGVAPPIDNATLKHFLAGYGIYFGSVWVLGTVFNAIYNAKGTPFFNGVNYMFMFDPVVADDTIHGVGRLFEINATLGNVVIYPLIAFLFFVAFGAICLGIYWLLRLAFSFKPRRVNDALEPQTR